MLQLLRSLGAKIRDSNNRIRSNGFQFYIHISTHGTFMNQYHLNIIMNLL